MLEGMIVTVRVDYRGHAAEDTFVRGEAGKIQGMALLSPADMPTGPWVELQHLKRQGDGCAPTRTVLAIALEIVKLAWASGGGAPLLYVCSREHARDIRAIGRRAGFDVTILRGSLRNPNPSDPLAIDWGDQGGSIDEHVVRIVARGP